MENGKGKVVGGSKGEEALVCKRLSGILNERLIEAMPWSLAISIFPTIFRGHSSLLDYGIELSTEKPIDVENSQSVSPHRDWSLLPVQFLSFFCEAEGWTRCGEALLIYTFPGIITHLILV